MVPPSPGCSFQYVPQRNVGDLLATKHERDRIDAHLRVGGPYLLGAEMSAADLQLLMYMRWSRNMPRSALEWPALRNFATLLRARASWQRLCDIEQLSEWRS